MKLTSIHLRLFNEAAYHAIGESFECIKEIELTTEQIKAIEEFSDKGNVIAAIYPKYTEAVDEDELPFP